MAADEKSALTKEALKLSKQFEEMDGRRPRLFLPELEDDDDKEARKIAATIFADQGWDVDVGPLLTPEVSAQTAADNDVHFIFYTSKSPTMTKAIIPMSQTLAMMGRDDILIAVHQVKKKIRNYCSATELWLPLMRQPPLRKPVSPCSVCLFL